MVYQLKVEQISGLYANLTARKMPLIKTQINISIFSGKNKIVDTMQNHSNPDINHSNTQRSNTLFGTFQIILGIYMVWSSLSNKPLNPIQLLHMGIVIVSLVYGILRMTGRAKSNRQQPWQFALMVCLTLRVIALAYFTRPKNTGTNVNIIRDTVTTPMSK
jgi:glycerol uptake facilitator-like aquaporin